MATIIKGKNRNKPWTVRYVTSEHGPTCQPGCVKVTHQRELSFKYRRDADDFKAKFEHDSRQQIFVDPRVANEKFRNVAAGWLERHAGTPKTKRLYDAMLRNHLLPALGDKRLIDVANDREGLQTFLLVTLPAKGQGVSQVRSAYMVVNAIVNDAIKSGKLSQSRIRGLPMPAAPRKTADDFVFPDKKKIAQLAREMPTAYAPAIYLMRGCGLRVSEALAVRLSDFREDGTVLRLSRQMAPDGKGTIPLKHRKEGEFRDVPVPEYVMRQVRSTEEARAKAVSLGFGGVADNLFPPTSRRQFSSWFTKARTAARIDKRFTPHSLRHVFASVALANAVPITDVSRWLGHRNIQTTFGIYSHFVPSSWDRARKALDSEWAA